MISYSTGTSYRELAEYTLWAKLQDIRSLRDLTPDSVRDILRASLRDPTLTLTTMGELRDMSGTNDAFNSSICSLEVSLRPLLNRENKWNLLMEKKIQFCASEGNV